MMGGRGTAIAASAYALAQLAAAAGAQSAPVATERASGAEAAVAEFIRVWRVERAGPTAESLARGYPFPKVGVGTTDAERQLTGCANQSWERSFVGDKAGKSVCPRWTVRLPELGFPPAPSGDEAQDMDAHIPAARRSHVRSARQQLLDLLGSELRSHSGDPWLLGQYIRFSVDQGSHDQALAALGACADPRWWCSALAGYVLLARAAAPAADSAFLRALNEAPREVRCRWSDLEILLDSAAAREYRRVPCGPSRDSLNSRIWWLSDPLLRDPGNERRAEHHARLVMVDLRRPVRGEAEHPGLDGEGPTAGREMLLRYGWPAAWEPVEPESLRVTAAALRRSLGQPSAARRSLFDAYAPPRLHSLPDWTLVRDPSHAGEGSWRLFQPMVDLLPDERLYLEELARAGVLPPVPARGDTTIVDFVATRDFRSWPSEHMHRRAGPLRDINGQAGTLRRADGPQIAVAVDLEPVGVTGAHWTRLEVHGSPAPEAVNPLGSAGIAGNRSFALLPVHASPLLVEAVASGDSPSKSLGRFRQWVEIAGTENVSAKAPAVSSPLLLHPLRAGSDSSFESRMMGTRTLAGDRLSVYWEAYALELPASVKVQLTLDPARPADDGTSGGGLRRLLGATSRTSSSTAVSVHLLLPAKASIGDADIGRIFAWEQELNLAAVPDGAYVLRVKLDAGGDSVTSSTRLTLSRASR
jgi:hypothetical protein